MPRKKSFNDVEGYSSISQELLARNMVALGCEPKLGAWNADTKTSEQKKTGDGIPQWVLQILFYPLEGDLDHEPEVIGVTVTAQNKPVVQIGKPIYFVGFGAWTYLKRSKDGRVIGAGRSFMADGYRQGGED